MELPSRVAHTQEIALRDPLCAFGTPSGSSGQPVDRVGEPQPFVFQPRVSTSAYLTLPASDGWWLVGEQMGSDSWQYQWLDPAGAAGDSWTIADPPLSFARGAERAIHRGPTDAGGRPASDPFGAEGPESERVEQTNPYAPFVQRITGGGGGHLYMLARLAPSPDRPSSGTFRLDPLSLETTGYAPLAGDNPGLVGQRHGVTSIDYNSFGQNSVEQLRAPSLG